MGVRDQPHAPAAPTPEKDPVPIVQETGWATGPVWTGGKSLPRRDSISDLPVRSQSLYRLSYPAHKEIRMPENSQERRVENSQHRCSGRNTASAKYYLLTPRCRVLPEQLTGLQLVKKFPAFHGTRRFINTLTSVRHLSLSWASQSCPYTHIQPPGVPS